MNKESFLFLWILLSREIFPYCKTQSIFKRKINISELCEPLIKRILAHNSNLLFAITNLFGKIETHLRSSRKSDLFFLVQIVLHTYYSHQNKIIKCRWTSGEFIECRWTSEEFIERRWTSGEFIELRWIREFIE
ncbi:hypothetical protein Dimus_016333 [Dionaea muscipula]